METATLYRLRQGLREYARWIATSDQLQAEEETMAARFNEISQEREQAAKSDMEPDAYFRLMRKLEGEQLDIWGQTPAIRKRKYNVSMQEDFAEMGQELVERIMQIPYWEQDAEQQEKVAETTEQLRKQGYSDEEIKEYIKYARYRRDEAEVAERKEEQIQFAEEHPVWASILSVPAKLVGAVTGTVQSLIDYVGSIGEEGYQAPNRNGMGYILNDFAQTVRGTVSKEIAEQTDWEIFGVNVASWGYETLLGVADFAAATLAGWGNIGTTLTILATERGTERFLQVLDQGGTMEQAFWSGVTTGALDRILNKLPVEKLLGKSSGKVRQTLWKTMKEQGLLQMGSEAAGRVTDIVADTVVMGEQSEYKRLEAQYLKQGLNGKEARRQALLDLAGSVAVSGGSGLVQGAALGSVAQLARRLFQMGNSGAEIEQEQPVQYINAEPGSPEDNVRDLYAYYRKQAQGASAQAGQTAVSAGQAVQAGDGSSQPVDATGAARVMLERAFPQDEQTSVQGVAQNAAAPVVNSQPVYSDLALADYMAKQAAQQKFGDVQQTPAGLQATMHAQDMSAQLDAMPEENVVASAQNDGTIETDQKLDSEFVQNQDIFEDTLKNLDDNILDIMEREGGHTLERHVARDEQYLVTRAQGLKGQGATTYYNKQIAIKATQNSIAQHAKEIVEWLRESTTNRLIIMTEYSFHVGYGVQKGETKRIEPLNKTRMVIERSNNKFGFRIITTYPLLK